MRIVVWNCKMALSRKRQHLYALRPDIAVIPECSQECLQLCANDGFEARWFGDNPRKGLGVLVAQPLHIARAQKPRSRWVVPLTISGGPRNFLLIAVWTMPVPGSTARGYIGQLYEAISRNPQWFARKNAIVCGDFNSNIFWDHKRPRGMRAPKKAALAKGRSPGNSTKESAVKERSAQNCKIGNHSDVVRLLEKRRLTSSYHHFFSEPQGQETRPTYYFYHHQNRPYHIDYVFLPQAWASQITSVEVGPHAPWHKLSDHVPLSVDVTPSKSPGSSEALAK